jgi:hypothetical protein
VPRNLLSIFQQAAVEKIVGDARTRLRRCADQSPIRFLRAWPQYEAVPFLSEADALIVSPALFERAPLHQSADIANHVLLGSETRPGDWTDWLVPL